MRELPEPEGQLAWQTYTRDQVLAIQKQAYEDGLRCAPEGYMLVPIEPTPAMLNIGPSPKNDAEQFAADLAATYRKGIWGAMLTASQEKK